MLTLGVESKETDFQHEVLVSNKRLDLQLQCRKANLQRNSDIKQKKPFSSQIKKDSIVNVMTKYATQVLTVRANNRKKFYRHLELNVIIIYHVRALIGQKTTFYQSIKHRKSVFYCFSPHYLYITKQMKKPKPYITL